MINKRLHLANIGIGSSPPSKKKQIINTSNLNDNNINNDDNGKSTAHEVANNLNHTCALWPYQKIWTNIHFCMIAQYTIK